MIKNSREQAQHNGMIAIFQDDNKKKSSVESFLFTEKDLNILQNAGATKRILIVEDDLSQMNILEELILEINPEAEIEWEVNADRAINRLASAHLDGDITRAYDVVISDIALAEDSSGMDVLLYCIESEPYIETVLISAHSRENLREKHFRYTEPMEFIQKPIDFNTFYEKLGPIIARG